MDPSVALLTQQGGYRPLATGIQHNRRFPTEGLPFTSGPMGSMVAMAATPSMQRMMGEVGMTPMGVGHDQNVYDRMMNQRFTMMQMQAMQQASQADRASYMQTFRGLAAVTGTPFGAEQRRAAQSLSNTAAMMSPLFAEMMPEFLDQMGGQRGSATVMARRMIDAGRYRVDPVSGRMGMSAESVGAISNRLYGDLYSGDNMARMKGVTAGQVGSMVQELQMRGMVGTDAASNRYMGFRGDDPRAGAFRAINDMRRTAPGDLTRAAGATGVDLSKGGGITPEDLDKLTLDPRIADKMRSFDVSKIKRSVKSYVDVVAAMRDIFGDMGKPNAPMSELIAGIEKLTMGGMSQIDPGRMSSMVRQTYNLAKQTGVTMDNVLMMQEHAAHRAGQMGIESGFAVQATQGALAFGGAYRAQGHAAHTAWGAMSSDQVQQLDSNLRVQAASSNLANRMAVATRMSESVGGFDKNTEAGRYVSAVRSGLGEYRTDDGGSRSVSMSDREFTRLMSGAKTADGRSAAFSEGDVQNMLGQRDTNREYVERYGMANTVRRLQGTDELHPFVGHRMQETLAARFRENLIRSGMGGADAGNRARAVATAISQKVTRGMFDMSTEEFASTSSRNRGIGNLLEDALAEHGMGDVLGGLTGAAKDSFLSSTADSFYGGANRALKGSIYSSFGNLQNVHRLTNRTTLDESDRQQMQAKFTSDMQEAMAPLGRGSTLQRAVTALQNARPDDPRGALGVVAESLGGVRIEDINRAIMPQLQKVNQHRQAVEDLQAQVQKTTDPTAKAALIERLDVARRELGAQVTGLAKSGEQFGLFTADTLSHADVSRALGTSKSVMTIQNDITGIRGNFGHEVSDTNLASLKASIAKDGLDHDDKLAIELGRRQRDIGDIGSFLKGKGGPLNAHQEGLLKEWTEKARGLPGTHGMNDTQLHNVAVELMQANVHDVDETKIGGNRIDFDTMERAGTDPWLKEAITSDARAVIRNRRRKLPYRATKEAVDEIKKMYPNITREEAAEMANMRVRAERLGIDEATVTAHRKGKSQFDGIYGEMDAIGELFQNKAMEQFNVSEAEYKSLTSSAGYADPSQELVNKFRDENKMAGKTDAEVKKEMQRRMIMAGKQANNRGRWDAFWGSAEGDATREMIGLAGQDVENVAAKLIAGPQMVQRLGTRAIDASEALRTDQQRIRELAMQHTGGDVAKLMAHDYSGIDTRKPGAADTVAKLDKEITAIQQRQRGILSDLASSEGLPGRQFQLGSMEEARASVLKEAVAGGMSAEQAKKHMDELPSEHMMSRIEAARRLAGSEKTVRDILGIPMDKQVLSDTDRARIAGARFGIGSEDEAKHLYGLDKWDGLSADKKAEALATMRKGFGGSQEKAMEFLGITKAQLDADRSGEFARKISAVAVGLTSDDHARQLLDIKAPERKPGESDKDFAVRQAAYSDKLNAVKLGFFNPALARKTLGVPEDTLPVALQSKVDQLREQRGNDAEAMRLMGKAPGTELSFTERMQHSVISQAVGVARRVSEDQQASINTFESADKQLETMAANRGLSVDEMRMQGTNLLLSSSEQGRMDAANKLYGGSGNKLAQLQGRADYLQAQLTKLNASTDTSPAHKAAKANLEKQLAGVKADIAKVQADRAKAEGMVGDDAKARGRSAGDYLSGKGWTTAYGLERFNEVSKRRDTARTAMESFAKSNGLSVGDMEGASGINKMLMGLYKQAADRDNANPVDVGRDLMKSYGFNIGDAPDDFDRKFSGMLETTAGRGMARRLMETSQVLKKFGKGDVAKMSEEYFAAMNSGKAEDMAAFRKDRGISDKEFGGFEQAMQVQKNFIGVGSREKLSELFEQSMRGGEMRGGGGGPGGGGGMGGRTELSGQVKLVGDMIDFAGSWGSSRAHVGVP